ncbi:hypothetical protein FIV07_12265 [Mycobacterium sp. THAF192]|nr:hypothetical protein FIV07_12265 [Mycobacterium sp. THAF192]
MSAASYPVDSATRTCCQGIGAHPTDCRQAVPDVALPPGADHATDWEPDATGAARAVSGRTRSMHTRAFGELAVETSVTQRLDGSILDTREPSSSRPIVSVDYFNNRGDRCELTTLGVDEALQLASLLIAAVAEIDGWVTR